ncbi:MAG: glycosyltransferase family 9 protein [Porticoccaceae bacterium]|nr:glycosyltransferase family 9 protein [Porticoccaceae bacterium]
MTTKHMGNLLVSLHCIQIIANASRGQSLLIVDEYYRDIIESVSDLGKVLYYPRRQLKKASITVKARLLYSFYRQLRQHQAKLLLDFDGQGQAATIAQLSGVPKRIGPANALRPKGVYTELLGVNQLPCHRFKSYALYPETLLGQTAEPQYPQLSNEVYHRDELQTVLQKQGIDLARPYACIHVGATKTYKRWPVEHYASIADWLADHDLQVILIGAGTADASYISKVSKKALHRHYNLCDQLSIRQLISLFQKARFFLGNDSGPMHLAAATGTDVYAIFGPTDEVRWGPLGSNANVIRNPINCEASCSKKLCPVNHRCINTLSVEQVKAALEQHAF